MRWWQSALACVAVAAAVYFGMDVFQYNEVFAVMLFAVGCIAVFFAGKINWALLFKKPREVYSKYEWKALAVADLEANYPGRVQGELYTEAEILEDPPGGILWISESPDVPLHERRCVFGSVYKDSKNILHSPLETIQNHLRTNFVKSKREVAQLYLRAEDKRPESLFRKPEEKLVKEVTT